MKKIISTSAAPAAIGAYSQAIRVGNTVYISGQIPLKPDTLELIDTPFAAAATQAFANLAAVAKAAGGTLNDAVKINIALTNMDNFALVNEVMTTYFTKPYPARAVYAVAALPKGAPIEIEAVLVLN